MPNNRDYVIGGVVIRTVIVPKDSSHNQITYGIQSMRQIEDGIESMRNMIRKGRAMGFSSHDLDPHRRELARLLRIRFHSTKAIYRKDVVVWSIPIVPRKDRCGRLIESTRDAAIRQLQELNAENGTNYQFA